MKTRHRSGFGVLAALFAMVVLPGQALAGNALNVNVTLPVANAAISGKITKSGGGAVAIAFVELVLPGKIFASAITFSDANGRFTFFDIPTGDYKLAVDPHTNAPAYTAGFYRKPSLPDHFTPFEGPATTVHYTGTKIGNVNVAVPRGHSIHGRIRAATGLAPLQGITVSANLDPSSGVTPFSSTAATTNASGDYALTGLPKGKYSVRAEPNANFQAPRVNFLAGCYVNSPPHNYTGNCAGATLVTITTGNLANKNVDVPNGHRITGVLQDAQGHDLCATISVSGTAFAIIPPSTTTCGAFAVIGLASDDYTVFFRHAPSAHFVNGYYANNAKNWVELGAGPGTKVHVTNADVPLGTIKPDAGHTISGFVKLGGQGVKNVSVTLHASPSGPYDNVSTNAQGKFTFFGVGSGKHTIQETHGTSAENLRPGYYRLGAASGNFTSDVNLATQLASTNHSNLVINPPPGFVISGKIQNAAHQGLATGVFLQGPALLFLLSNAQGDYQAIGLGAGDYKLSVASAELGTTTYRGGYYTTANANHYTPNFGSASPIHVGP